MPNAEDKHGALFMIASSFPVLEINEAHGYYIVVFKGTSANLMYDMKNTTREEIQQVIDEAQSA